MNVASGACVRAASSRFSVPLALTVKSVWGSRGRPIVRRLRSGVDDEFDLLGVLGEHALDALGVADIEVEGCERVVGCGQPLGRQPRRRLGAEDRARMSLSIPTTWWPCSTKNRTDSEPIRPPDPVMMTTDTVFSCHPRAPTTRRSLRLIQSKVSVSTVVGLRRGRQSQWAWSAAQSESRSARRRAAYGLGLHLHLPPVDLAAETHGFTDEGYPRPLHRR